VSYLIAVVALLSALCLVGLVLILAVVRRLREHTKLLDALYEMVGMMGAPIGEAGGLAVGDVVGDFDATTLDGTRVTRDLLPDGTVVAFLSPDCPSCREQIPEIGSWVADEDRPRVLVVVDSRSGDPAHLVTTLPPMTQVIVDDRTAPVADVFGVRAFPAFFQVAAGGELLAMAPRLSRLPAGSLA
jgi:thiol-disulfide isomerase/thioredoxin